MLLETERLFIRYFSEEDKGDLYDYLSREEVVKYEPYTLYSRQAAAEEAARRAEDPDFFAVALKSGKVICICPKAIMIPGSWVTYLTVISGGMGMPMKALQP